MKVAIIGSRGREVYEFEKYLPAECKEIISGGAKGIDSCAAEYARRKGLVLPNFCLSITFTDAVRRL